MSKGNTSIPRTTLPAKIATPSDFYVLRMTRTVPDYFTLFPLPKLE